MLPIIAMCALAWPSAALADAAPAFEIEAPRRELPPYLQCVPFARERSGIQIYGDAHTWWNQAAGRYQRGTQPRVGAVMAFRPSGNMVLGHVAAVARVIDNRTVLLDHANWSPIDGRRGQIERGVKAVDVSLANDWSEVRVWYAPIQDLGTTAWPVAGFIYNEADRGFSPERVVVAAAPPQYNPPSRKLKKQFDQAFADFAAPVSRRAVVRAPSRSEPKRGDPITAALARYGS